MCYHGLLCDVLENQIKVILLEKIKVIGMTAGCNLFVWQSLDNSNEIIMSFKSLKTIPWLDIPHFHSLIFSPTHEFIRFIRMLTERSHTSFVSFQRSKKGIIIRTPYFYSFIRRTACKFIVTHVQYCPNLINVIRLRCYSITSPHSIPYFYRSVVLLKKEKKMKKIN